MRFLVDQDVYRDTIRFLRELGHDLVLAADLGMSRAPDEQLLQIAVDQDRIFVTRDKDFGNLVFVHQWRASVICLRIRANDRDKVHRELARALLLHTEDSLRNTFMTVTAQGHRVRRLPSA